MSDSDDDPHFQAVQGMPWYVTGRLDGAEEAQIREHLAHCETCRVEWERERALQALISSRTRAPDTAAASFARLQHRLDDARRTPRVAPRVDAPEPRHAGSPGWQRVAAALAGAAVLLGLLEFAWVSPHYRTATSAPTPALQGTRLRVLLAPNASVGSWVTWLNREGAQVTAGPAANGAWTVSLPVRLDATALQTQLARWRAQPEVRLVEPIGASP